METIALIVLEAALRPCFVSCREPDGGRCVELEPRRHPTLLTPRRLYVDSLHVAGVMMSVLDQIRRLMCSALSVRRGLPLLPLRVLSYDQSRKMIVTERRREKGKVGTLVQSRNISLHSSFSILQFSMLDYPLSGRLPGRIISLYGVHLPFVMTCRGGSPAGLQRGDSLIVCGACGCHGCQVC